MTERPQLTRLRRRGRHLSDALDVTSARRDPAVVVGESLAPLSSVSWTAGSALAILALAAPAWTGDARAALLAGVPAAAMLASTAAGREPRRRRVAMVVATTAAGFLALATAPSIGALADLLRVADEGRRWGLAYPAACCAVASLHLGAAWPAWRRANAVHDEARAAAAMYDEL